jgi:hypothetical protein
MGAKLFILFFTKLRDMHTLRFRVCEGVKILNKSQKCMGRLYLYTDNACGKGFTQYAYRRYAGLFCIPKSAIFCIKSGLHLTTVECKVYYQGHDSDKNGC